MRLLCGNICVIYEFTVLVEKNINHISCVMIMVWRCWYSREEFHIIIPLYIKMDSHPRKNSLKN